MGDVRAFSTRKRWTEEDEHLLRENYASSSREELSMLFPERKILIQVHAKQCRNVSPHLGPAATVVLGHSEDRTTDLFFPATLPIYPQVRSDGHLYARKHQLRL